MTKDIDKMTTQEIIEYIKSKDKNTSNTINAISIKEQLRNNGIHIKCPNCDGYKLVKNGKNKYGVIQYKCKDCNKRFTVLTNTIFEGINYTWDEMVDVVFNVINKRSIDYIAHNVKANKMSVANTWLLVMKILYLLSKLPKPPLTGVIQIDEKYFRENQKGNHDLISMLDINKSRKARRHNYHSECGIFGPEFVNVLCAVDSNHHYYAKCVCLGPMSDNELLDLEGYINSVSYICTDNLEIYNNWTNKHNYKHYIEPSFYRKNRKSRGYINTDDIYKELSEKDYQKDREINEKLYKEGLYPHIENTDHKLSYDEFIALKYKFGLSINSVNSFHNRLEKDIIKSKTGVSLNYLPLYIEAYTYLENYKTDNHIKVFTIDDANNILIELCKYTLTNKDIPANKTFKDMNINDLPRPSKKSINNAKRKMFNARNIIIDGTLDRLDRSAYEGDDNAAQYIFNKRKFFSSLGTTRINELIKLYDLYQKGLHKKDKVELLSTLPNAEDIIFYEIYLNRYGSINEFENTINSMPKKRKRGRPKKI